MMATDDTSRAVVVVVVGGCRCLIHPLFVLVLVVLALVLPPKYYWSHHVYIANKVDTKNIVRQVSLHRAAPCEQTAQDIFKSRHNVVGHMLHQKNATVGIPPTIASWTNSPPPPSSIHWDDHVNGMITSTTKNDKP